MPRYKLLVEYDGEGFAGWQRQDNGVAVQEVVEEAIRRLSGASVTVFAAGRTDAGVHARGQVCHFDLERDFPPETVRDALNFHMKPAAVVVRAAEIASLDFHARFSAVERSYLYRILNRRVPPALEKGRVWWVPAPLDAALMEQAAQRLVGRHDFSSFRAAECQAKSPVKTLDELAVRQHGEEIHVSARARSFLHHQVRNMVGTLKLVGEGRWTGADVSAALEARNRAAAGPTAPASGLYLMSVGY
jgi:tRNA pseudouridine38-40 synthase